MLIKSHRDLDVYQNAVSAAVDVFALSKGLPREEQYSLTDQVRRSSRSVCANIAEAWRKRKYEAAFVSKLNDAEAEAAETQVWLELANRFSYITAEQMYELDDRMEHIIAQLSLMAANAGQWTFH